MLRWSTIVTMLLGGVIQDVFQFNVADDILAFVGVSSCLPFDRLEIRDLVGTIDNEC